MVRRTGLETSRYANAPLVTPPSTPARHNGLQLSRYANVPLVPTSATPTIKRTGLKNLTKNASTSDSTTTILASEHAAFMKAIYGDASSSGSVSTNASNDIPGTKKSGIYASIYANAPLSPSSCSVSTNDSNSIPGVKKTGIYASIYANVPLSPPTPGKKFGGNNGGRGSRGLDQAFDGLNQGPNSGSSTPFGADDSAPTTPEQPKLRRFVYRIPNAPRDDSVRPVLKEGMSQEEMEKVGQEQAKYDLLFGRAPSTLDAGSKESSTVDGEASASSATTTDVDASGSSTIHSGSSESSTVDIEEKALPVLNEKEEDL